MKRDPAGADGLCLVTGGLALWLSFARRPDRAIEEDELELAAAGRGMVRMIGWSSSA